jgi:hypothetical protein
MSSSSDPGSAIRWLSDLSRKDAARAGGKASTLGALLQAGLPVPPGFCIFRSLDEQTWGQVVAAYRQLAPCHEPVVVRSSGLSEDSRESSFAGQYLTVLDVEDEEGLRSAVERCQASLHAEAVSAYKALRPEQGQHLPVLVQRQITATLSGVLFTSDPRNGDPAFFHLEVVRGAGEQLVSGKITPSAYRIRRDGRINFSPEEVLLTPAQCLRLHRLGLEIEDLIGPGQDIEWVMAAGQIYIVQARPIVGAAPLSEQDWTRANIGEVLPGVVTPLTWSLFRWHVTGRPEGDDSSLRLINGRAHLKRSAVEGSFDWLIWVKRETICQALGLESGPSQLPKRRHSGREWLASILFVLEVMGITRRLVKRILRFKQKPLPAAPSPTGAPPTGLVEQIRAWNEWTRAAFSLHLYTTTYATASFGLLKRPEPPGQPEGGEGNPSAWLQQWNSSMSGYQPQTLGPVTVGSPGWHDSPDLHPGIPLLLARAAAGHPGGEGMGPGV